MELPRGPSDRLSELLSALPARRRKGVLRIVAAEAAGEALTHLLKTPYSCQWCGLQLGQSGQRRDDRKALLAAHEAECGRRGRPWRWVCTQSTYYSRWCRDPGFREALDLARAEVQEQAIVAAVMGLRGGAGEAVTEVRRIIREGASEATRLRAAFGLLDRAGVETAQKGALQVQAGVEFSDVTDAELEAIEQALRDEAARQG